MRHFRVPIAKALIVALMLSLSVPIVAPAWADGPRQVNEDQAPDPKEVNAGDPVDGGGGVAIFIDPDFVVVLRMLFSMQLRLSGFGTSVSCGSSVDALKSPRSDFAHVKSSRLGAFR